jgi:hypothetical protein
MATAQSTRMNPEVTVFLDNLKHPLRTEIQKLREVILKANPGLSEDIKWNAPNYSLDGADRITMKILPPKNNFLLIFHGGVRKKEDAKNMDVKADGLELEWRGNDRAILTIRSLNDITSNETAITKLINQWLKASR